MIKAACSVCNIGGDCRVVGKHIICEGCLNTYNKVRTAVIEAMAQKGKLVG